MDAARTTAGAVPITTGTLILIGVGMVLAIGVIWWGTMLRRRRAAALAEAKEHAELAGLGTGEVDSSPITESDPIETPTPIAEPAATPAPTPTPTPTPTSAIDAAPSTTVPATASPVELSAGLPLTSLKGLGPRAATQLATLGIDRIDQLAALSPAGAAALDAQMGALAGRIARDRWVEQARLLVAGDRSGFEAAFGKLGG